MRPRIFNNFQPGDHIRSKKGEIFQIIERETFYCKGCECKKLEICDTIKEKTTLVIQSQRGRWNMSLMEMNDKYINKEIDQVTFHQGLWR